MDSNTIKYLLEYTMKRYDSSLKSMLDIGDINIDDVNELLNETHHQLKELLAFIQSADKQKQS
jgi:hypothetical protein